MDRLRQLTPAQQRRWLRTAAARNLLDRIDAFRGQMRDVETLPAEFPLQKMVTPKQVVLHGADGLSIHGQLFLPPNAPARAPAVVFFHGGSRRQMMLGWHPMYYYSNAYALNKYFANSGYVVLSVNYRSGIGYGMEFREALEYGASGASEYRDASSSILASWSSTSELISPEMK